MYQILRCQKKQLFANQPKSKVCLNHSPGNWTMMEFRVLEVIAESGFEAFGTFFMLCGCWGVTSLGNLSRACSIIIFFTPQKTYKTRMPSHTQSFEWRSADDFTLRSIDTFSETARILSCSFNRPQLLPAGVRAYGRHGNKKQQQTKFWLNLLKYDDATEIKLSEQIRQKDTYNNIGSSNRTQDCSSTEPFYNRRHV